MNVLDSVSATKSETNRELAKAKTRHTLLKSALQLYSVEGAFGMSMNKIAKGAGIAQPSFYNHFDSLDALQQVLGEQLKDNYLSPMRMAWADMLKDYPTLSKEDFNERCQECLTLIFDAAFQNITLFQRLLEDSLRFDSNIKCNGLGSLIIEIRDEWTKIFIAGLQSAECSFDESDVHLCVDISAAQVHELILGCHQQRYSRQQAIEILCKNFDGVFSHFFTKDKRRVDG